MEVPRFVLKSLISGSREMTVQWGFLTTDAIEAVKTKIDEKKMQRKPALIPPSKNIKLLAARCDHVLALLTIKVMSMLGRRIVERTRFQALTHCRFGLPKIGYIACGAYYNLAINAKGQVYTWGLNNFGRTGIAAEQGQAMLAL